MEFALTHEQCDQSIEVMAGKVRENAMEYLRRNGYKIIRDIVRRNQEIPKKYRGAIMMWLMFQIETA